ncbi:MAG TPA: hypothetical protein VLB44_21690 [Kofleriaceae bacterium]|nr:hypothetical protein [Kofleriaceae bacterium]
MRQIGLLLVLVACAHNVPQDQATGPDGRIKGAKPIALQEGEGRAKGIVTYPGGDRVDWKLIELPEGKRGKLDLQLKWRAPRPGLRVAFDVFDQWNTPIVATAAAKKKAGKFQMATIDNARGKYFVRVYAPKRGDAGAYELVASFQPADAPPPPDLTVPDPPRLPAVPTPEPECDPFDVKIKACEKVCPEVGAPAGWIGCRDKEKAEKDAAAREEAEKARIEAEKNKPKPFTARINHLEVQGDDVQVTLPAGTNAHPGLDRSWSAVVLNAQTGRPIAGAVVTIIRVGTTMTLAKVHMTIDQLNANPTVQLSPP